MTSNNNYQIKFYIKFKFRIKINHTTLE